MSQEIVLDLFIPADEWLRIYRDGVRVVSAKARDGRRVQFPANILQPYVSHAGVTGSFVIRFDTAGRFLDIARIAVIR